MVTVSRSSSSVLRGRRAVTPASDACERDVVGAAQVDQVEADRVERRLPGLVAQAGALQRNQPMLVERQQARSGRSRRRCTAPRSHLARGRVEVVGPFAARRPGVAGSGRTPAAARAPPTVALDTRAVLRERLLEPARSAVLRACASGSRAQVVPHAAGAIAGRMVKCGRGRDHGRRRARRARCRARPAGGLRRPRSTWPSLVRQQSRRSGRTSASMSAPSTSRAGHARTARRKR